MIENMTGVILAGGLSHRFGSSKACAPWKDKKLIDSVIEILTPLFSSILILTKKPEEFLFINQSAVQVAEDLFQEAHPLGGLFSAFYYAKTDWIFVCGCDMPFIAPDLIHTLAKNRTGCQAVVPVWQEKCQPLCALYSQSVKEVIAEMIREKNFALNPLFDLISTHFLKEDEIKAIDREGISFFDIDTAQDYERAKEVSPC